MPAGPKGRYAVVGQAGIGVMKKSPHAEQAADFLAFFTNPANSAKLAQFFPPPRRSQLTAETLAKTNPKLKPEQLQKVVIDGITNGTVKPSHSGQAELSQQVRAALDPLWKADADVKGRTRRRLLQDPAAAGEVGPRIAEPDGHQGGPGRRPARARPGRSGPPAAGTSSPDTCSSPGSCSAAWSS
ncbi:hypothetical protein V2I01_00240 [Micromonospora sp. BRA006-A]|nr:hypothetical protein [Micromonospora sp. BRA006-A]